MVESICLLILGSIIGVVSTAAVISNNNKEEIDIKKIEPPLVFREERNIVIANAEFSIPYEDMVYPVSSKWIECELSHKLAEQIWKYAMVNMTDCKRERTHIYRARLQVVDCGQLNPFYFYGERREGE